MPEWLVERGIGETRAGFIEDGEIIEARVELDGVVRAGAVILARLLRGGRNAIARDAHGTEYLLPRAATGVTEGANLNIEVTREAIPGSEPWKRPLARATDKVPCEIAGLAARLSARELTFPVPLDVLGEAGWDELVDQARTGFVDFPGGQLRISATPAMTLIDVDGYLDPGDLAVHGATAAAKAVRRLDIGGSIGVDLPTVSGRAVRQAAGAAIDAHLQQPFERTAVNGFGFVQIVRPRARASLVELAQDRASFEARALLRRTALEPPGARRLVAHPGVIAALEPRTDWLATLAKQVGGEITLHPDPALSISAGYAEPA